VRIGSTGIGIRTNTIAVGRLLRQWFAPFVMTGVQSLPSFSLRIEDDSAAGPSAGRTLHALYEGCIPIIRTRSARQAIGALRYSLGTRRSTEQSRETLVIPGQSITFDQCAVILPPMASHLPTRLSEALVAHGYRRLATQDAMIDVGTGDLIVPEPFPCEESAAREILGYAWDTRTPQPEPGPGRFTIVGWIFDRFARPPVATPATALAQALRLMTLREQSYEVNASVKALASIVSSARLASADESALPDLVSLVREMLPAGAD
jgi:hypothetical protein